MKRFALLAFALFAFLGAPSAALATEPPSVTGVSAQAGQDGLITVRWTAVYGDAAAYRVYYSQKSILENDGYYDDAETSSGPATEYVLQSVPATFQTVYIAVMAVNAQGEESGFFIEETHVTRTAAVASSSALSVPEPASSPEAPAVSSAAESSVRADAGALHLLSAQALSATGVELKFSAVPVIDPAQAPVAFGIVDGQGAPLAIRQLTIDGETVTVRTVLQTANVVYQVQLKEPLQGADDLPLDALDRTAFFTGHATGIPPRAVPSSSGTQEPPPPPIVQSTGLPDVVGFRLETDPQSNRLVTVSGHWSYDPLTPPGAFVAVRQSRDGGRTFGQADFLPRDFEGIRIPDVAPENFGVAVYMVDHEGRASPGVFRSVSGQESPAITPPQGNDAVPPQGSIIPVAPQGANVIAPEAPKTDRLTQSGASAMLGLAALGAFVGWKRLRKAQR